MTTDILVRVAESPYYKQQLSAILQRAFANAMRERCGLGFYSPSLAELSSKVNSSPGIRPGRRARADTGSGNTAEVQTDHR